MLAELMLPDQAHVRSQDWTIFFLHKDPNNDEDAEGEKSGRENGDERNGEKGGDGSHSGQDADDQDSDVEGEESLQSIEGPSLVYVLNLVNTKQDNTVKRRVRTSENGRDTAC